jgi:hypothetical protein
MARILSVLVLLTNTNELLSAQAEVKDVTVLTAQGLLRGLQIESVRNQQVFAFLGIPYARPPVGDLRFKVRCMVYFLRLILSCSLITLYQVLSLKHRVKRETFEFEKIGQETTLVLASSERIHDNKHQMACICYHLYTFIGAFTSI